MVACKLPGCLEKRFSSRNTKSIYPPSIGISYYPADGQIATSW